MTDAVIFTAIILVVIALVLLKTVGIKQLTPWAKSKEGKGALASMVLGVLVILAAGLFASKAQAKSVLDTDYGYFINRAYVFAGVDYTKKVSPQCVKGSQDDRLTSNMGFGLNLWDSPSRRVSLDLQYTHHSCMVGVDRNSYDGLGIKATWTPWTR